MADHFGVKITVQPLSDFEHEEWASKFNPLEKNPTQTSVEKAYRHNSTTRRISNRTLTMRGGPGSGHHGHKGRPGEVGGSLPSDAGG